jgi:hypothetical protein
MARMGSGPPMFDGINFSYWKSRIGAYLDALSLNVWNATKTGYTGALTPENKSGMLRLEIQLSKALVGIFLLGLIILILLMICGFN